MAAGRNGGFRDNEFRVQETNSGTSKKESEYSDTSNVKISKVERVNGRGLVDREQIGYRNLQRQTNAKERGVVIGVSNRIKHDMNAHSDDREPGELSSDGYDGPFDSIYHQKREGKSVENGGKLTSPQNKKRKFSPIIWDRDDKASKMVSGRGVAKNTVPATKSPFTEPRFSISDATVKTSNEIHASEVVPSKMDSLPNLHEFHEAAVSPLPVQESTCEIQGLEMFYDDNEDIPARTIISSRWANDANSPADEGEIYDYEEKSKSSSELAEFKNSIGPEIGKLRRDRSEGINRSYNGSDKHARSSSRDSYRDTDERIDFMDLDERNSSDVLSDSNSECDFSSHGTPEPHIPQRNYNMLQGCRNVDEFERLNKINEGTYGVVYRAKDKKSAEIVALKKVKMEKEREGFPLTSLREINILLSLHHPSIVDVKEVVVGSNLDSIFMVMEYMEHDLKGLMETMKQPFSQSEAKCLMLQLLEGINYLHNNWVLHRDLKSSNLLLNNRGELKICDFGLARQYGSPLKPYTHLVVTLWYRAPELLLGAKKYSTAIDMWSLGCIMAELLLKEPLFCGKSEVDQLDKIFKILGTPNEEIWPGFSELPGAKVNFVKHKYNMLRSKFPTAFFTGSPVLSEAGRNLLDKLLTYDPNKRITAEEALDHEWFREVPLPKSKEFMPTFPAQHAQDRRMRKILKSPDPLEEQRRKELRVGELGSGGLFG